MDYEVVFLVLLYLMYMKIFSKIIFDAVPNDFFLHLDPFLPQKKSSIQFSLKALPNHTRSQQETQHPKIDIPATFWYINFMTSVQIKISYLS